MKLRKLEETIWSKFKSTIIHWFRYVDDIFAIVKEDCIMENFIENGKTEMTVWDIDSAEEGAGMSTERSFGWT